MKNIKCIIIHGCTSITDDFSFDKHSYLGFKRNEKRV